MIFRKLMCLTLACFITSQAMASAIINGDFATCDYSGWQKDTDGFGDVSASDDFTMVGSSPNCAASINVDYQNTEAFLANTLYQQLDFSAANDSTFLLTMEFDVNSVFSDVDAGFIADYFVIGLFDGLGSYYDETGALGFLVADTDINGSDSYSLSFNLDNWFVNQTGWSLDFQLNLGADFDGNTDFGGSSLIINNVSLTEVPSQAVSAPGTVSVFALGLLGLMLRRKSAAITLVKRAQIGK